MTSRLAVSSFIYLLVASVGEGSISTNFTYMGCFDLSYSLRENLHHHTIGADFLKCVSVCDGKLQVGIERSDNFCYCGEDIVEESTRRNDSLCSVACPDERNRTCGGDWLMSVYKRISPTTTVNATLNDKVEVNSTGPRFLLGTIRGVVAWRDGITFDNLISSSARADTVDYHFDKQLVFALVNRQLYKASMNTSTLMTSSERIAINHGSPSGTTLLRTMDTLCMSEGFTVDWVQDRLYFSNCSNSSVDMLSVDLEGGDVKKLFTRLGGSTNINKIAVDPYRRKLFWTADGTLEGNSLSGNNFLTNLSAPELLVRVVSLDLESRRVYYVGSPTHTLFSVDYQGRNHVTHYSTMQLRDVYGLGVYKDSVYWLNFANMNDILYKGPKTRNVNNTLVINVLTSFHWPIMVMHMTLLHQDLQSAPKISCKYGFKFDPETYECVERILPNNSQARRLSPGSQEGSRTLVWWMVGAAAILLSAALLAVGKTMWPSIKARLPTVPYNREQGKEADFTPQYHADQTDDNVQLI